ncbi:hypothetical protein HOLDEFILI_02276 [Holdemania filiformis DSM 12042]|uniref:Uncharacterized protein n=1 Tax=Holdemania filiformis DSM 12042 TaxID=545696 RepID=B9Y8X6_9FIRM|nr:hypothetical protein HOLDEFILI_02276 [Holdemania filiformis DSM 12042]
MTRGLRRLRKVDPIPTGRFCQPHVNCGRIAAVKNRRGKAEIISDLSG